MSHRNSIGIIACLCTAWAMMPPLCHGADGPGDSLRLTLRSRVQPFKGTDDWVEVSLKQDLPVKGTAIIICDMWDDHWCKNAARRCDELAKKMAPVIDHMRDKGVFIIHAPSECMDFYKDSPARRRMQEAPKVAMPKPHDLPDPALPCDSADGGCDDDPPPKSFKAWKRQHAAIHIDEEKDGISDNGQEVYSVLQQRGIKNLIIMGVHTNMCVLHRTFAIKPMTRAGVRCVLVRDLTDAMYSPKSQPYVSHEEGTERIIQHIEKNWCPTVKSADLR
jgi:nicotinamidase-related amidase